MRIDSTFAAARIVGPILIALGVSFISHPGLIVASLQDFAGAPSLFVFASLCWLTAGLTLITLHRRWDGFTAALVSLAGYAATANGALCLIAPDQARALILTVAARNAYVPIVGCVFALLGAWLSYAGYVAGIFRADHD